MASGYINGSFSGASASQVYPRLEWSSVANTSANTSSVTVILYFMRPSSLWQSYNLSGHTCNINIHTNGASANRTFDLRSTTKQEIWRRTVNVAHGASGSCTLGISASGATGVRLGSYNVGGSITLDKIPRAFEFIVSTTTVEMGTPCTVNVKNNGSGFEPWLYLNFGGKRVNYGQIPVGSDFNFTPSVADFAPRIPNATSGWGTLEVETWSGNTFIGRYQISPFTLTLPASVQPSLTSLTASDEVTNVPTVMGSKTIYVQSLSSIRFSANGVKGGTGANIAKYTFSLGTVWSSDHNGPLYDLKLFNFTNFSGSYTAKVVITDTRGRTASKTMAVNILPYTKPILSLTAVRTTADTTKVLITPTGSVSSLKNGTAEKNPYSIKMEYKLGSATTWTTVPSGELTSFKPVTLSSIANDKSYNLQVTLKDKFFNIVSTQNISTATVLLDLFKDVGVGIGKLYEEGHGVLDVGGAIYTSKATHNFNGSTINNVGIYSGALPAGDVSTRAYWQSSAFPNGISSWWSDNNANVTNKPSDYAHVTLFKFETEIKVIWSEMPKGEVSSFYANSGGQTGWNMGYGLTGQKLWTGTVHVIRGETLTISKPLSKCKNGWILKWMWYRNNKPSTEQIHFHVIHKSQLEHIGAGVSLPFMHWSDDNKYTAFFKYVYVGDNTISGNAINNGDYTTSLVLSGVYEF